MPEGIRVPLLNTGSWRGVTLKPLSSWSCKCKIVVSVKFHDVTTDIPTSASELRGTNWNDANVPTVGTLSNELPRPGRGPRFPAVVSIWTFGSTRSIWNNGVPKARLR